MEPIGIERRPLESYSGGGNPTGARVFADPSKSG
jgi:hypothetical protein